MSRMHVCAAMITTIVSSSGAFPCQAKHAVGCVGQNRRAVASLRLQEAIAVFMHRSVSSEQGQHTLRTYARVCTTNPGASRLIHVLIYCQTKPHLHMGASRLLW